MAGDWIKMRADLFTHPKVVRMASALKADKLRTVGGLMSVWCLFDAHSIDGELDGYTFAEIDDHIRWPGFSAAMCTIGWLSEAGESLVLPEFDTHNGQSAKRRAQDADRKREVRNVSSSQADKKRTREEKRREEKKEINGERSPTGSRLPADWEMSNDMREFCHKDRPDLNPDKVAARFADYWRGVAGAKGRKADWLATWRNWVRNESQPKGLRPGQIQPVSFAQADESARRKRWEEMTGRKWPTDGPVGDVVEVPTKRIA